MADLGTLASYGVALATVLALAAVAVNFSLAAGGRARVRSERRSPVATLTMLAFFGVLYLVLRLGLGRVPMPRGLVVAGLVLLAAGSALNLAGRLALAGNWSDHVVIYQDHQFVARGAYRLVRHPLYAALIWMAAGACLALGNLLGLALVLGVFVPAMVYRARQEEAVLTATFPGYADYRRRTGMLVPMPWLN